MKLQTLKFCQYAEITAAIIIAFKTIVGSIVKSICRMLYRVLYKKADPIRRVLNQEYVNNLTNMSTAVSTLPPIPVDLIRQLGKGNGVLFVGSGLSTDANLPNWRCLVEPLADEIGSPKDNLVKIPQYYVQFHTSRHPLLQYIMDKIQLRNVTSTPNSKLLAEIARQGVNVIFTTNYDLLLEETLRQEGVNYQQIAYDREVASLWDETSNRVQLVKLHGSIDHIDTIIITENDYREYFSKHPSLKRLLAWLLMTRTFLFVGYSLNDPNFNFVYDEIWMDLKEYKRPAYAVLFDADPFMKKDYEERALKIINIPVDSPTHRSAALNKLLQKLIDDLKNVRMGQKPTPTIKPLQSLPSWIGFPKGIYARRFPRPVPCGISIGRYNGAAGTLGCLVRDRTDKNKICILSSWHLLVGPDGKKGDKILQPSTSEGGKLESDVIAILERWVDPSDQNDAAIAQLVDPSIVQPKIMGIGNLKGISEPRSGASVKMAGRTSGVTYGKITDMKAKLAVSGYPVRNGSEETTITFDEILLCSEMSEGGDTGAILVDERNNALGMCFAGSAEFTLFLPIRKILDALNVDLVTA
jgi:hypothetical protein